MACVDLQAARSIISFYREIMDTPEVDLHSIEDPIRGSVERFWENWGSSFRRVLNETVGNNRLSRQDQLSYPLKRMGRDDHSVPLFCSWKKGPNGPSILSAGSDLCALYRDEEQLASVKRMLAYFDASLPERGGSCDRIPILSRVVAIPDKGGKTRHIAIGDSWTQLSLGPLHRLSMRILSSLSGDYTFKQGVAVSEMLRASCPKYS